MANVGIILGSLIVVVIAAFVAYNAGKSIEKKTALEKIGSAENKARTLLDEAIKKAESTKVNALLEAKEEILKQKTELENELMSLPTNSLKMKQNIRNDGYIVLTSIKNKPSSAIFF